MKAHFATEAEMCAEFIEAIGEAWTAYPETDAWDILLVRKADGFQIGIQAKLSLNVKVLCQATESYPWADMAGPDCRAVLVPSGTPRDLSPVLAYIGLTIIRIMPKSDRGYTRAFYPELPGVGSWPAQDWHEWSPARRCDLPEYVPDVVAGASAPLQLTSWKIGALKLAVLLERRGYLLRSDFKHIRIDHRRWMTPGAAWLICDAGRYTAGPHLPNFKAQHPRVFAEIAADIAKWGPTDMLAPEVPA